MSVSRRSLTVYIMLAALLALVGAWQAEEHFRVRTGARNDLRNRSKDIANTVSACIRGMRFRGTVFQERLEPMLKELVGGRSNELVTASQLLSIVLLNAAGEAVASAGRPIDFTQADLLQSGERWGQHTVTFVNPVDLGASLLGGEGVTNPTVVLPPMSGMTNNPPEGGRGRPGPRRDQHREQAPRPPEMQGPPPPEQPPATNSESLSGQEPPPPGTGAAPGQTGDEPRPRQGFRRPPWMRGMDEAEFRLLMEKRALHGLAVALTTDAFETACARDLWMRSLIFGLAALAVVGGALAWRNLSKSADLEIRLVRASELNTHLKELSVAAAGLAHETRNPLNIIRGLAQVISKQPDAAPETRRKAGEIANEADKVAVQLNEFINYSRPREVRRTALALGSVINEVVRTLGHDLEEKKLRVEVQGEPLRIEADEQLLRQALFNLLINAIQAADYSGEIQAVARRDDSGEGILDVRDSGPGVPPERRAEIFKPYFTTQKEGGTGLGLAVVQQIVLAHGWEIQCLANEPRGAVFRITHIKIAG